MTLVQRHFDPIGVPSRPGIMLTDPKWVTIHWIGPYPGQTPWDCIAYWQGKELSAHFIVKGLDVVNYIPINEVAWHVGCHEGNYTSIGIEVVPHDVYGSFSQASVDSLRDLYHLYFEGFGLKRHWDWTGKACPQFYTPDVNGGDERWQELKEKIING